MKGYVRENTQQITAGYSALRKCRNAVSAGVLSPISSAVGRNGAVGDTFPRSGARNYIRHGFAGAPVSLRVGQSADLTRHRRVIQHREPLKGKAWRLRAGVQRKFTVFLQNLKVELRKASML